MPQLLTMIQVLDLYVCVCTWVCICVCICACSCACICICIHICWSQREANASAAYYDSGLSFIFVFVSELQKAMVIITVGVIKMTRKAKMLAIMRRLNVSDPKINSNPKRARHCRPQHALPHIQVSENTINDKTTENTINDKTTDIKSSFSSQQHITADELCGLCNLVFHWSCGNSPFLNVKHKLIMTLKIKFTWNENAIQVLCVPWLRWKCPDLERPIRVGFSFILSLSPLHLIRLYKL